MYPTANEIQSYLLKMGKRGERTLSLLGKEQSFIKAIGTELGRELMADLMREHESLLDKISSLTATEEEKMQYKVVRKMLLTWSERVVGFKNKIEAIKQQS